MDIANHDRVPDPGDARVARLGLTPDGAAALELLGDARHCLFAGALAAWSGEDLAALAPLLRRLAHDLVAEDQRS